MRKFVSALVVASLLATSSASASASYEPGDRGVEDWLEEATRRFDRQDYAGSIDAFEAAYAITPDPNFLYNIGRVHEEAGELDAAVRHYREFARQPSVTLDLRRQALERIQVLRGVLEDETPTEAPPAMAPPPTEAPLPNATQVAEPPSEPNRAPPPLSVRRLQWAGIVTLGAGVLAAGAAATTGGLAWRESERLGRTIDPADRQRIRARGQALAGATDGLLAGGVALALAGFTVTFVALARRAHGSATTRKTHVSWSPTGAPRHSHEPALATRFRAP